MTWALMPLKDLVQAKTRLSGTLAPSERRALAQAMAEDVLAALSRCDGLEGILLISDDPGADLLAGKYQVELLPESELSVSGLNPVIEAGCRRLREKGVEAVMVVHGDLPLLTSEELEQMLAYRKEQQLDLVICPDRRQDGTNIMLCDLGRLPPLSYGRGSCGLHQQSAEQADLAADLLPLPGAALDVDQPADLVDLSEMLEHPSLGEHTAAFLGNDEIRARLSLLAESTGQDSLEAEA